MRAYQVTLEAPGVPPDTFVVYGENKPDATKFVANVYRNKRVVRFVPLKNVTPKVTETEH